MEETKEEKVKKPKKKKAEDDREYSFDEMQELPFAKIVIDKVGEDRRPYHKKNVWELDVTDLLKTIDPQDYFCTTGEAVIKAKKLEMDLFLAAGVARKLKNILKKLRGENVYLETHWADGRLLLKAKNPRKNKEEKAIALEENFEYGERQQTP